MHYINLQFLKSAWIFLAALVFFFVTNSVSQEQALTAQEKKALGRLRPLIKNLMLDDYQKEDIYLARWLRAQKLDLVLTAEALRESQQWRKQNKIDSILNETIFKTSAPPYDLDARDKLGRPVLTVGTTGFDIRKYILSGKRDQLLRYLLQSGERAVVLAREGSNGTSKDTRYLAITDLHGFSVRQHGCLACIELFADWTRQNENNYPGSVAYDIWINTPRIALPIVEILTPLMSEEYKQIFRVFGSDRKEWASFLLKLIPADQLTYQFGGTKPN